MQRLLLPFCLVLTLVLNGQNNKVLLIGIDGCRPDALVTANAPHLQGLLDHAVYSLDALTHYPTWSGAGWSSMLTGVWEDKHGVLDNTFAGSHYDLYPHFFDRIEAFNPNLKTYSVSHWGPINDFIVNAVDGKFNVSTDAGVRDRVVQLLINEDPDALFMQFDDVDHAGHAYGFSPEVPEYLQSIEITDEYVGDILMALSLRPHFSEENWLVLVSTDHGGNLAGHGGPSLEERNMFVIAHHPALASTPVEKEVTTVEPASGLAFNGIDQYLLPEDATPFQFGADQDFSVELRVQYTQMEGDVAFVCNKNWDSGLNTGFVVSTPLSDQSRWKVNIGDGSHRADLNGGVINDGNWHHLAVTFDRDSVMTLYQDGERLGSTSIANVGSIDAGLPLVIGQDGTLDYPAWMNGYIGEVRIWNKVLDEQAIRDYSCILLDAAHPDFSHLLAYWPVTDGVGSSIADVGPLSDNCILAGDTAQWVEHPGSLTCVDYSNTPRTVDVAVTVLTHLCIPIDSTWQLDGHALVDLCTLTATKEPVADDSWVNYFSNPFRDQLAVVFDAKTLGQEKHLRIFDANGRVMENLRTVAGKVNIATTTWPTGVYSIQIWWGGHRTGRILIKQ